MSDTRLKPPIYYYAVALLLMVWNLIGCYFCYLQFRLGADWMSNATAYDRTLYAGLPGWYDYCYALGVGAGALGGIALLARAASARTILIVSLIAIVVQFGYLFAATDVIARKGIAVVVPFPMFIAVVAIGAIWFASHARRRRWTG